MVSALQTPGGIFIQYDFRTERPQALRVPTLDAYEREWMQIELRHLGKKRATAADRARLVETWRLLRAVKEWLLGCRLVSVYDHAKPRRARRSSFGPRRYVPNPMFDDDDDE